MNPEQPTNSCLLCGDPTSFKFCGSYCRRKHWRIHNLERDREHQRTWNSKNKDKLRESTHNWRKNNPDKVKQSTEIYKSIVHSLSKDTLDLLIHKMTEYTCASWSDRHLVRVGLTARDGNICSLCGQEINISLIRPDPMSPAIDHIIPRSRGGLDTWENVQLTHFICNSKKWANYASS